MGIGDDCAVLPLDRRHDLLVTTDFSLEGVHFRRDWHPAESVGHRCLGRGLSDIAAMAGEPLACFLSLGLPADVSQEWVDGFVAGFLGLAKRFRVPLAGGDTGESKSGSVGLSTDLAHICEESGVGAELEVASVPVARDATLEQTLHGGEDYELLFTASEKKKVPREIAGVAVRKIGRVTRDPRQMMWLVT